MNTSSLRSSLLCSVSALLLLGAAPPQPVDKQTESKPEAAKPGVEAKATDEEKPQVRELGSGWGTLKGTFKFRGEIPKPREFKNEREPGGPKVVVDDSLLVDPKTRGLSNVLIFAVDAPRVHPDFAAAPKREVVLTARDFRFSPRVVASTVKDKHLLANDERFVHNMKGAPGRGNRDFNWLLAAKTRGYENFFRQPLVIPYDITCAIHPWERAWHIVRPDPYFAVTAADGTFTIERLPAGTELEFQVWHERSRGDRHGLQAKPEWSEQGRFKLTIPKDGDVTTLDVEVDAEKFE